MASNSQSDNSAPSGIRLTQEGNDLIIERKWDTWNGVKNGIGGLLLGYVVFYLSRALIAQNQTNSLPTALLLDALIGVFIVVAVYLVIRGIYSIINTTTLRVTPQTVSTLHHPIPWRNKLFPSEEIKQVFVTSRREEDVFGGTKWKNDGRNTSRTVYTIKLILADGTQPILVTQLFRGAQAVFIEQQIEQHLNITDTKVKGEV